MISKRKIFGTICFFIALSLVGLLDVFKANLDTKILGISIRIVFFLLLIGIGYFLIRKGDLI